MPRDLMALTSALLTCYIDTYLRVSETEERDLEVDKC